MVQATDMAAEYAAKLALLHEEGAARADTERRKRRERYIMLADLQAQAQVFSQKMCFIHQNLHSLILCLVALRCDRSVNYASS